MTTHKAVPIDEKIGTFHLESLDVYWDGEKRIFSENAIPVSELDIS